MFVDYEFGDVIRSKFIIPEGITGKDLIQPALDILREECSKVYKFSKQNCTDNTSTGTEIAITIYRWWENRITDMEYSKLHEDIDTYIHNNPKLGNPSVGERKDVITKMAKNTGESGSTCSDIMNTLRWTTRSILASNIHVILQGGVISKGIQMRTVDKFIQEVFDTFKTVNEEVIVPVIEKEPIIYRKLSSYTPTQQAYIGAECRFENITEDMERKFELSYDDLVRLKKASATSMKLSKVEVGQFKRVLKDIPNIIEMYVDDQRLTMKDLSQVVDVSINVIRFILISNNVDIRIGRISKDGNTPKKILEDLKPNIIKPTTVKGSSVELVEKITINYRDIKMFKRLNITMNNYRIILLAIYGNNKDDEFEKIIGNMVEYAGDSEGSIDVDIKYIPMIRNIRSMVTDGDVVVEHFTKYLVS